MLPQAVDSSHFTSSTGIWDIQHGELMGICACYFTQTHYIVCEIIIQKARVWLCLSSRNHGWSFEQGDQDINIFSQHLKDFERYFPTLYLSVPGIPYSEHSSFLELKRFVQWLQPKKIIPTVNVGSWRSRKAMEGFFREWQTEPRNLRSTSCALRNSSCGTRQ